MSVITCRVGTGVGKSLRRSSIYCIRRSGRFPRRFFALAPVGQTSPTFFGLLRLNDCFYLTSSLGHWNIDLFYHVRMSSEVGMV